MSPSFRVFGFGSLMFAPELPEKVLRRLPARLEGYRRAFNKRSRARSCPRHLAFDAFPEVTPAFRQGGVNHSLALGTVRDPEGSMEGVVLEYAPEDSPRVLALLDAREGYDPQRPSLANGYIRTLVPVLCEELGVSQEVWCYQTNPDPACMYHVAPEMSLGERARILINATPREGATVGAHPSVRGLHYLEGVRRDLRTAGICDDDLEAIVREVRRLDGPWQQILAP